MLSRNGSTKKHSNVSKGSTKKHSNVSKELWHQASAAAALTGGLTELELALLEPAWKGGDAPGMPGGRPNIGRMCAKPLEGSSVYSIARL